VNTLRFASFSQEQGGKKEKNICKIVILGLTSPSVFIYESFKLSRGTIITGC
jgi:hypothetical protein